MLTHDFLVVCVLFFREEERMRKAKEAAEKALAEAEESRQQQEPLGQKKQNNVRPNMPCQICIAIIIQLLDDMPTNWKL